MNDPIDVAGQIRETVVEYIEQQARWRESKAEEYPEDTRNQRAADGLHEMASYVRSLPLTDERLARIQRCNVDVEGDGFDVLVHHPSREVTGWDLSRFRFHNGPPESIEDGLEELVRGIEASWREMVDEAVLDEAERAIDE